MSSRQPPVSNRHCQGLTMLELLITLSVAGILLVMAVPAFERFTRTKRMSAAVATLHNDLLLARSAAVHRNLPVIACPGDPGSGCASHNDWTQGWIVFVDTSGDQQRQPVERLVRHGQGFDRMRITGSPGRTRIRFFPNGSTPGSNGSIAFCGLGGPAEARRLVISNLGRIRRDRFPAIDPADCPPG